MGFQLLHTVHHIRPLILTRILAESYYLAAERFRNAKSDLIDFLHDWPDHGVVRDAFLVKGERPTGGLRGTDGGQVEEVCGGVKHRADVAERCGSRRSAEQNLRKQPAETRDAVVANAPLATRHPGPLSALDEHRAGFVTLAGVRTGLERDDRMTVANNLPQVRRPQGARRRKDDRYFGALALQVRSQCARGLFVVL